MSNIEQERTAFIRQICERPDDDVARLVFADWLEEHGDGEQAEFIRNQMADDPAAWRSCQTRWFQDARDLADGSVYCNHLLVWHGNNPNCIHIDRGFVRSVHLPCIAFMAHAAQLFAEHPVTEVRLTRNGPYYNGSGYCWYNRARDNPNISIPLAAVVPVELYQLMRSVPAKNIANGRWLSFATVGAADDALSAACVSYGRSLAGLPPLLTPVAAC